MQGERQDDCRRRRQRFAPAPAAECKRVQLDVEGADDLPHHGGRLNR
jgi:hypothetical protein